MQKDIFNVERGVALPKTKRTKPKVTLLHITPIHIIDNAIGKCWDIECDETNFKRMDRVINKFKHASTAEHGSINFEVTDTSRCCLQEVARHRIGVSPSVKSTRYTLKELKEEEPFICSLEINSKNGLFKLKLTDEDYKRASKYLFWTGIESVDNKSIIELEMLRMSVRSGIKNDVSKYNLPESYKTKYAITFNVRSLQNFISLRSDKSALQEIRELADSFYQVLPDEYKFLFKRHLKSDYLFDKVNNVEIMREYRSKSGDIITVIDTFNSRDSLFAVFTENDDNSDNPAEHMMDERTFLREYKKLKK